MPALHIQRYRRLFIHSKILFSAHTYNGYEHHPLCLTVVKFILWILCLVLGKSNAVRVLAVDQRNDVLSNSASLLFSGLAGRLGEQSCVGVSVCMYGPFPRFLWIVERLKD